MSPTLSPFLLTATDGSWYAVLGDICRTLVSSEQSGGAFTLVEIIVRSGGGTPPHIHTREDETFYILEGEVEFWVDGKTIRAMAGSTVFGPRGIPHRYTNTSSERARFLVFANPGGLDRFFAQFSAPIDSPESVPPPVGPDVIRQLLEAAPRFGLEILPPPGPQ